MLDSADHRRTTLDYIAARGLVGAAIYDPATGTLPFYRDDGSLWFTLDQATGREIPRSPPEPAVEPSVEEWLDLLHGLADDEKTEDLCYFIGAGEGMVKIGYSKRPERRLRDMQMGCPVDLSILAVRAGGAAREAAYHAQFSEHRVRGEWFERHPDILAEIERLSQGGCNGLDQ